MAFLSYPLPIALMSIVLSYIGIPSLSHSTSVGGAEIKHLDGFRELFKHRLAIARVIGSILESTSFTAIIVYGISLYREKFLVPQELPALLWLGIPLSARVKLIKIFV